MRIVGARSVTCPWEWGVNGVLPHPPAPSPTAWRGGACQLVRGGFESMNVEDRMGMVRDLPLGVERYQSPPSPPGPLSNGLERGSMSAGWCGTPHCSDVDF